MKIVAPLQNSTNSTGSVLIEILSEFLWEGQEEGAMKRKKGITIFGIASIVIALLQHFLLTKQYLKLILIIDGYQKTISIRPLLSLFYQFLILTSAFLAINGLVILIRKRILEVPTAFILVINYIIFIVPAIYIVKLGHNNMTLLPLYPKDSILVILIFMVSVYTIGSLAYLVLSKPQSKGAV